MRKVLNGAIHMTQKPKHYKLEKFKHYKLEGTKVVECDLYEWAKFFESDDRILKQEYVKNKDGGDMFVSTVFLGIDHGFFAAESAKPIVFETMVFTYPEKESVYELRCATYSEALRMHKKLVKWAQDYWAQDHEGET
jgi:hypothetical protein